MKTYVIMRAKANFTELLEIVLEPKLLTDISWLKEIYDLTVSAWENSKKKGFINREIFPKGWSDELDWEAQNWIIINEHDQIITSARFDIFYSLDTSPYGSLIKDLYTSEGIINTNNIKLFINVFINYF